MNEEGSQTLEEHFASLVAACDEALAAGSAPVEINAAVPAELRQRLERGVACMKLLRQALPPEHPTLAMLPGDAAGSVALTRLGRFELRRELGHGAFGIVWLAHDPQLRRDVALKVPRAEALVSPEARQRFLREARAAAGLDHPNVVPVYEAGEVDAVCYIASAYCPGTTLAQWLKQRDEPVPAKEAALLVATLAEAVEHAHRRGVVHRDLKPSNVLLETLAAGEGNREAAGGAGLGYVPRITDFGLAKVEAEGEGVQTQSGAIVGTPAYMAPEQAGGRNREVGPAADTYALGAILYEVLTGRPPFLAETVLDVLVQVRTQEPVSPSQLRPGVPRDLVTVCLKCLQKEPARRYASALALADDLRRFLDGRPIQARPVGPVERLGRWCRRNPVVAALTAFVLLLLAGVAVSSSALSLRLGSELKRANEAERERSKQLAKAYLEAARARRFSRRPGQHFESLKDLTEAARIRRELNLGGDWITELRNEVIASMVLTDLRSVRQLEDFPLYEPRAGVWKAPPALTPRWDTYARALAEGAISVRRVEDDGEFLRLPGAGSIAGILAFSPDGRHLLAKYYQGEQPIEYVVWDWRSGRKVVRQACGPAILPPAADFAFMPDSRHVLLGCRDDCSLGCYDLDTGMEVRSVNTGAQPPWTIAVNPDGRRLAVGRGEEVVLVDIQTGTALGPPWRVAPGRAWQVAWDSAGDLLAAGCTGGRIFLWDANTHQQRAVLEGHDGAFVIKVAFNHAGNLLASNAWDGTTRLWDPFSGKELLSVTSVFLEFSRDDRHLAYLNGTQLGIWEMAEGSVCRTLHTPTDPGSLDFSPEGRLLASGASEGVYLWDTRTGEQVGWLRKPGPVYAVRFHPRGDRLFTSSIWGLHQWPVRSESGGAGFRIRVGRGERLDLPHTRRLEGMSLDREGHKLAVGELWQKGIVLDLDKPARPLLLKHPRVNGIALSPDGRWAAASTFKGEDVPIWDLSQGDGQPPVKNLPLGAPYFSPDGAWLVVPDGGSAVRSLYRVGSWDLARQDRIDAQGSSVSFTCDSRVMAVTSDAGRQLRLLDPATGREWATLVPAPPQPIGAARFSPDGSQLALSVGRSLQLWDLRALRRRLAALGLDWDTPPFEPAAVQEDAGPLVVEVDPRPPACGPLPLYEGEMKRTIAELGPDHPDTAGLQAQLGLHLLQQEKYSDAEPILRECLAGREKTMPDAWLLFNAKSLLGGSLLGQKKCAEAEPLLLDGYEGMRQRASTIPEHARVRLTEGLERIVQLYDAWGKKDQAAPWRKKLEEARKPSWPPPPRPS